MKKYINLKKNNRNKLLLYFLSFAFSILTLFFIFNFNFSISNYIAVLLCISLFALVLINIKTGLIDKEKKNEISTKFKLKNRSEDDLTIDKSWKHTEKLIKNSLIFLKDLLPYNSIILYLKNDQDLYELVQFVSKQENKLDISQKIRFRTGYIGWTLKEKSPLIIGNTKNTKENIPYYNFKVDIRSFLSVPILNESLENRNNQNDDPLGILVIDSLQENAFNTVHKTIASMVSSKINNLISINKYHNLYSEKSEKLDSLYKYIEELESNIDSKLIIENLLKTLKNIFISDLICISINNGNKSYISNCTEEKLNIENKTFNHIESLVGIVTDTNKPFNFSNLEVKNKSRILYSGDIDQILEIRSIKSLIIYPISISSDNNEEVFGAVVIGRKTELEFNSDQRQHARILVQQAAKGIKYSNKLIKISEQALIDGLSGLYNQRYFKEMLSVTISRATRYPEKVSLMLFDLDDFKSINDEYGHLAGDKIISEIGKTTLNTTRNIDIAARYGGDEFAVILPNTDDKGALKIAEKIKSSFDNKIVNFNEMEIKCSFSIGIATFPDNAETKDQLFNKADEALYKAKSLGKNVIFHSSSVDDREDSNLKLYKGQY